MMRAIMTVVSVFGTVTTAVAHAPGTDETVADQLSHQLLAAHHFPGAVLLTALLIASGALVLLRQRKNSRR